MTDTFLPKEPAQLTHSSALIVGALLVFIDAFVMSQGVIAGLVGIGLVVIGLPRAWLKKPRAERPYRLRNLAIYAVSVILVFALNVLNNRIAANRAEVLVVSVKAFHAKNGRYPATLNALIPEFIDHVPVAKYALGFSEFRYHIFEGRASLSYVDFPPFGRPTYSFTKNEWSYWD